jgi:alanyl-tRNA synthetase
VAINALVVERLDAIAAGVERVDAVMGALRATHAEQERDVAGIADSVVQVQEVTQRASEHARRSEDAVEALSAQVRDLDALVSAFTLARSAARSAARPAAVPVESALGKPVPVSPAAASRPTGRGCPFTGAGR